MRLLTGCFLSAVLGGILTVWMVQRESSQIEAAQVVAAPAGPAFPAKVPVRRSPTSQYFNEDGLSPEEAINVDVYEAANRGVAHITTKGSRSDGFFFLEVPSEGTGSGSVIDSAGHILTNFHVIEDAHEVAVTLHDGKTYDATFIGADAVNDIAIIKVDAPAEVLSPVALGDSSRLRVGMRVFAIGNPFGLERTLTTGIISSLNRSLQIRGNRTIKSIIQIDAAINPGNSGGPLLDSHGRLIGMNTAIASNTGQSSGVGFAIPSNLITRVVPQLIAHGRVIRPLIGIEHVYETEKGLLIARVRPGGPAEKAGLRGPRVTRNRRGPFIVERVDRSAADLIVAVDDKDVKTHDDFLGYIESKKPGDRVVVTIVRDGKRLSVPVILEGPAQRGRAADTRL